MTPEEIREERAGTVQYYVYDGCLVKRQWSNTRERFYIFGYKNNEWIPDWTSGYTLDFEGERLDETAIKRYFNNES